MRLQALKEVLRDRIKVLEAINEVGQVVHRGRAFQAGSLEGRLEEARVVAALVDRVTEVDIPPLFSVTVDEHGEQTVERVDERPFVDPNDPNAGTDTPASMRARREEAEPGVNRFDPRRC